MGMFFLSEDIQSENQKGKNMHEIISIAMLDNNSYNDSATLF